MNVSKHGDIPPRFYTLRFASVHVTVYATQGASGYSTTYIIFAKMHQGVVKATYLCYIERGVLGRWQGVSSGAMEDKAEGKWGGLDPYEGPTLRQPSSKSLGLVGKRNRVIGEKYYGWHYFA